MTVQPLVAEASPKMALSGIVCPTLEPALRAERALREHRFEDAAKNMASIPQDSLIGRYWCALLASSERLARRDLAGAETLAWQAVGNAATLQLKGSSGPEGCVERLIARALNQLGVILRREERAGEAIELHRLALRLRAEHGSTEEQWDTLIECALDTDLTGDLDEAIGSIREALAMAALSTERPEAKRAIASDHLVRLLTRAGRFEEAVAAARSAKSHWVADDAGAGAVFAADVRLAGALITEQVARREAGDECHNAALEEAETLLASAAEALTAFGPALDADVCWARAQRDFVRRLHDDASA